jgi:hypothetical protein
MQKVIILPGLGDHVDYVKWVTRNWNQWGLLPIIHSMDWRNHKKFETKLQKLLALVDEHSKDGAGISIVGLSAGGSAALNLFTLRSDVIKNAVNICGRLRQGNEASFKKRTKTSPAFAESVLCFEKQEQTLSEGQRKRIMTIRADFGDELVPADTATLEGAINISLPTIEHNLTIYLAMSIFSKILITFLKK